MAHGKTDNEIINKTHNTARFFVEVRQISWVLLIGVLLWGVFAYFSMPQRKDPEIAVRQAVAITPWPGASAEKIEQLVTKKIEEQMAANAVVTKIESISRTSVSYRLFTLSSTRKRPRAKGANSSTTSPSG